MASGEAIEVRTAAEPLQGMRVRFDCPELSNGPDPIRGIARRVCETMPMTCVVDEREVRRRRPIDRLVDQAGRPHYDEMLSMDVDDVSVVVARYTSEEGWTASGPTEVGEPGGMQHLLWLAGRTNAIAKGLEVVADHFGQLIEVNVPQFRAMAYMGDEIEDPMGHLAQVEGLWSCVRPKYLVVIEATGSRVLVPRLPDRREFVANEGLARVANAAFDLIARLAARAPRNGVGLHARLRERGIEIPAPQAVLRLPLAGRIPHARGMTPHADDMAAVFEAGRLVHGSTTGRHIALTRGSAIVTHLASMAYRHAGEGDPASRLRIADNVDAADERVMDEVMAISINHGKGPWVLIDGPEEMGNVEAIMDNVTDEIEEEGAIECERIEVTFHLASGDSVTQSIPFAILGTNGSLANVLITKDIDMAEVSREAKASALHGAQDEQGHDEEDARQRATFATDVESAIASKVHGRLNAFARALAGWIAALPSDTGIASMRIENVDGARKLVVEGADGEIAEAEIPARQG